MMNKYIKIEMEYTKNIIGDSFEVVGGYFRANANFKLDNIPTKQMDIEVKIDTGCSISVLTGGKLNLSFAKRKELKLADIRSKINPIRSYGVETGGEKHKVPNPDNEQEMFECTALKFPHQISDFEINGVPINAEFIHINYDRNSNILIGMDILKDWDIHMGTIVIPDLEETGKTIFLACPKDSINQEYLLELERLFGIGSAINYALINGKANNKEA